MAARSKRNAVRLSKVKRSDDALDKKCTKCGALPGFRCINLRQKLYSVEIKTPHSGRS